MAFTEGTAAILLRPAQAHLLSPTSARLFQRPEHTVAKCGSARAPAITRSIWKNPTFSWKGGAYHDRELPKNGGDGKLIARGDIAGLEPKQTEIVRALVTADDLKER